MARNISITEYVLSFIISNLSMGLHIGEKIDIYTSLSTLMLLDKCLFSLYIQGNETGYNNQWKDYCEFIF